METELLNILLNYFPKKDIVVSISNKIEIRVNETIIYEAQSVCHKKIIMLKKDLENAGYKLDGVVSDVVFVPGLMGRLSHCKVKFIGLCKIPISKRVSRKSLLSLLLHK